MRQLRLSDALKRLLLAGALLFGASRAQAQTDYTHTILRVGRIDLISHHPACDPFAMAFDPLTFDGRGFRQPRILWHGEYKVANTLLDAGLKAIHTPTVMRWPIVHLGLPLAPHMYQMLRDLHATGRYQMNLYDWFYDFTEKQPIEFSRAAIVRDAVMDVPLSCFARP
jgi:hypothetical protein